MAFQKGNKMRLGKKHSEETKEKISIASKGRKSTRKGKKLPVETRIKMSIARKGLHHSKKTKEKIRLANIGRKHTEETKEKIGQARLGKYKGSDNPCWRGGRHQREDGYVFIFKPEHINANSAGYILEHRLIMEEHLGRSLD